VFGAETPAYITRSLTLATHSFSFRVRAVSNQWGASPWSSPAHVGSDGVIALAQCSDGIWQNNEDLQDCGGVCASCVLGAAATAAPSSTVLAVLAGAVAVALLAGGQQ
jgi:hypothetical protein